MIFQLSDWFPKHMIWAIIVKFDQIKKNWWHISCAEILEVGKIFFAASSVKQMSRFEEVSPEKIKRTAWKFTNTVILLGLAGYELTITNSAYGLVGYIYISSYPVRPWRITVKYYWEDSNVGSWFECASVELWMHAEDWVMQEKHKSCTRQLWSATLASWELSNFTSASITQQMHANQEPITVL